MKVLTESIEYNRESDRKTKTKATTKSKIGLYDMSSVGGGEAGKEVEEDMEVCSITEKGAGAGIGIGTKPKFVLRSRTVVEEEERISEDKDKDKDVHKGTKGRIDPKDRDLRRESELATAIEGEKCHQTVRDTNRIDKIASSSTSLVDERELKELSENRRKKVGNQIEEEKVKSMIEEKAFQSSLHSSQFSKLEYRTSLANQVLSSIFYDVVRLGVPYEPKKKTNISTSKMIREEEEESPYIICEGQTNWIVDNCLRDLSYSPTVSTTVLYCKCYFYDVLYCTTSILY